MDMIEWNPSPAAHPRWLASRIRRGRGIGSGKAYVPWLKVRDVPSKGTSSQIYGIRTHRTHHLLSQLEAIYFLILERDESVLDIREQYPILDIAKTLEITSSLGVRHKYQRGKPEPFTIDFLLTVKTAKGHTTVARSIKPYKDLQSEPIRRKLAVEAEWCGQNDVSWKAVDTRKFDDTMLQVLRFIRGWYRLRYQPNERAAQRFTDAFLSNYRRNVSLSELLDATGHRLKIDRHEAESLFKYSAWSKRIPVSFKSPLKLASPLIIQDDE